LKVKKAAPAPTPGGADSSGEQVPGGVQAAPSSTEVDDNMIDEGASEADVPGEFEYLSDGGDDED
jgi:26S proteasome regulatory subunit N2